MKLLHVMRAVYCEPWLIRPDVHAQISEIVRCHLAGIAHSEKIMEGFEAGAEIQTRMMENGVMVIPVEGVIGKRVSALEKSSGVVDCDDLAALLSFAGDAEEVKGVVLDFNSPGGTVTGTPEVAGMVAALAKRKTVVAYTETMCCSAAYWIASQATAIYASPSSSIGSIGVYMPFLDQSRAAEMAGLKQEVFRSGKYKGMGVPGTSLTDEQRQIIQDRVNLIHAQFKAAVRAGRGQEIDDEDCEGQDFYGAQCVERGLINNVVEKREVAIREAAIRL